MEAICHLSNKINWLEQGDTSETIKSRDGETARLPPYIPNSKEFCVNTPKVVWVVSSLRSSHFNGVKPDFCFHLSLKVVTAHKPQTANHKPQTTNRKPQVMTSL